LLSFQAAL
jgi:hypothetical protein